MSFWTFLANNANFYLVTLVTLFLWDIIDLYIELRNFHFVRRLPFWTYFGVVGFFSIAAMEAGYILNIFTAESKYLVAFFIPLIFAVVLENLVVKIGGLEKTINISEFFDKFRFTIKSNLDTMDAMNKVRGQTELLNSEKTTDEILEWCRFYYTNDEMKGINERTEKMDGRARKIEVIKFLLVKAPDSDIIRILQGVKRSIGYEKQSA
jgi:hypothetical protein